MKIGDSEYLNLWEEWITKEYNIDPKRPNEMRGYFGWFNTKEREFQASLKKENKLNEEL